MRCLGEVGVSAEVQGTRNVYMWLVDGKSDRDWRKGTVQERIGSLLDGRRSFGVE